MVRAKVVPSPGITRRAGERDINKYAKAEKKEKGAKAGRHAPGSKHNAKDKARKRALWRKKSNPNFPRTGPKAPKKK